MRKKYVVIAVLCVLTVFTFGCAQKKATVQNTSPEAYQLQPPVKGDTIAVFDTNMGEIKVKLFPKEAPKAVENFVKLSNKGYYDSLIFHRVINNFMIQGGDPLGNGTGGESIYGKPFEDEFSESLHNYRGALSMANSGADTNGSQFFIVQNKQFVPEAVQWMQNNGLTKELMNQYEQLGGTPWLDNKHTVFGQVYEGMDVVDKIAEVQTDEEIQKPLTDVVIKTIKIEKYK